MPDLDPGQWIFLLIALPIAVSDAVPWISDLCYQRSHADTLSTIHWLDRREVIRDDPPDPSDADELKRHAHNRRN